MFIGIKLKNFILKYKGLIGNFSYLSILEVVKLVLPFITIPHLIKTLGVENYGLVAFAQALAMYFTILVNFGLDISAVKNVSVSRNNKEKLSLITSSILAIKSLLFIVLFVIVFFFIISIPSFNEHRLLYIFSMSICLSEIFCPAWYFQGIEKMKHITYIRVITYSVYTILIFLFIKDQSDYFLVPMLLGIGTISGGILAYYTLIKKEKLILSLPSITNLKYYFRDSIPFFLSRLSNTINTTLGRVMAGFFLGMNEVAVIDIAEKVVSAGKIPIQTLSSVLFPHIAVKQDKVFVKKMFLFSIALGLILTLIVFVLAKPIVILLTGTNLIEAIPVLRFLSLMLFISSFTFFLGSPVLVSFGYVKAFNLSSISSTLLLLSLYSFFYFTNHFSIMVFIFCALMAETFVAIYRLYFAVKYNLIVYKI